MGVPHALYDPCRRNKQSRDDAGLFTSAGRSAIERAAEQNNVRVVVITNNQRFPSRPYRVLLSITNAVDTPSGESLCVLLASKAIGRASA